MVSTAERGDGGDGGLFLFPFFCLGSVVNLLVHLFILLLLVGTKGSGWELRHLTGSPRAEGALDSVIL